MRTERWLLILALLCPALGQPTGKLEVSVVTDAREAKPIANATVQVSGKDFQASMRTDSAGMAAFANLPAAPLRVTCSHPGYEATDQDVTITDKAIQLKLALLESSSLIRVSFLPALGQIGVILLLVVFWFIALNARYWYIAAVSMRQIESQVERIRQMQGAMPAASAGPLLSRTSAFDRVEMILGSVIAALETMRRSWFARFWFWNYGEEVSALRRIHEAELVIVSTYDRAQTVARLQLSVLELSPQFPEIAQLVKAMLEGEGGEKPHTEAQLREMLQIALRTIFDDRAVGFETSFNWQNKAFMLIGVGVLVLSAIVISLEGETLIVMGLAGGLVSRLMRSTQMVNVPSEFGSKWTTLFLSPIYGAFTGWFGLVIIEAAYKFQLLGSFAKSVSISNAGGSVETIAMAFLLGFSERLFTNLANSLDDRFTPKARTAPNETGGVSAPAVPAAPATPPTATPTLSEPIPNLVPGQSVTLKGKGLDKVKVVELVGQAGKITLEKASATEILIRVAGDLAPGTYAYSFDTVVQPNKLIVK